MLLERCTGECRDIVLGLLRLILQPKRSPIMQFPEWMPESHRQALQEALPAALHSADVQPGSSPQTWAISLRRYAF